MSLTIDTTIEGASSNSYITVAEASTYIEVNHIFSPTWEGMGEQERIARLIAAGRAMNRMVWKFPKNDPDTPQAMSFPVNGETTIPQEIQDAQAEMVLVLYDVQDATTGKSSDTQRILEVDQYQTVKVKFATGPEQGEAKRSISGGSLETVAQLVRDYISDTANPFTGRTSSFAWER